MGVAVILIFLGFALLLSTYGFQFVLHPLKSSRFDTMSADLQRIWLIGVILIAAGFGELFFFSL